MRKIPILFLLTATLSAQPTQSSQSVKVVIDPRIELMSMVQLLNGYHLVSDYNTLYRYDAQAFFTPYKDHEAVRLFAEMSGRGFSFDAVPKAMILAGQPPELKFQPQPSDLLNYVETRADGRQKLDRFMEVLKDFAAESRFMTFLAAHQGTFEQVLARTRESVEKPIEALSRYTGLKLEGGTVVLGMLLHHGGFAGLLQEPDGQLSAFAFIGPVGVAEGLPDFGPPSYVASLVWHEFSHTLIEPLGKQHAVDLDRYSALYEPIAEQMRRQAYGDWRVTAEEHIIRAVTVRLIHHEQGEEAARKELESEVERGFAYVEALVERLLEYEKNRERYPSLAEFYPRLIDVFREAANR